MIILSELLSALPVALPWLVLMMVFIGMACLQWRVISALDQALMRTAPVVPLIPTRTPTVTYPPIATAPPPAPAPVPAPTPAPVQHPAPPPAPPAPTGAFAAAPPWFNLAVHEIGFHETGNNQGIDRYIGLAHCGAPGDAWCAIFANAMLEQAGITGSRSPSSQSFRTNANFVQLIGPALGAIVVYWRGSQTSGLGHVGFYRGEDANSVWTLGGNENDMVQIEALPKSSASFGLIGYWWPKAVPLPVSIPVMMPTGSATHVQIDPTGIGDAVKAALNPSAAGGLQTNITATMFGGQQSAYGGPIVDAAPGVALPFHFKGARPRVRVTGKRSGVSIDCDIVDVGPWNINDPYWETGARPQAESGTDLGQVSKPRKTNSAGIDLTLAAAQACQIDGKGLVDWQFIQSPASPNIVLGNVTNTVLENLM